MNKRLQGFIAGILVCCMFLSVPVLATGATKTIKAVFNKVTVRIDGKTISGDKLSYNGNVFVSAKSIAECLGKLYTVDKSGNVIISTKKASTTISSNISKGKEVKFPDKDFDTLIRKIINKPTGSIYEGDLLKITEIDTYSRENICNLEGIQYIKNLKTLIMDNEGDLDDISLLAKLTELQTIAINNKKVSDVSALSNLKKIKSLSLNGNKMENIDIIKNLISLKTLRIDNNNIKSLNGIENLINLEEVSFIGNPISDISPLKGLKKLKENDRFTNFIITKDNKYFSLDFVPTLNADNKNYFLDRYRFSYRSDSLYIDENAKIYSGDLSLITALMNASQKQYDILKSDNPFVDGVLNIKNYDYKNESKPVYTSVNTSYQEGEITNKDGTTVYEYSLKPNEEKGVVKVGRYYLHSIDDIFKTFGISFSVEYDKDKKLCGFKF